MLRYVVLALLALAILRAFVGHLTKSRFTFSDNLLAILLLASVHLQFIIGLALYFKSPVVNEARSDMKAAMKDDTLRFWAVEHLTLMLLAVILITLGRIFSKRAALESDKFRRSLIFYAAGLIFIIAGIPWDRGF